MPTFNYNLLGIATQTELGNGGTTLDASRLIERRGQNAGLANNLTQPVLTLPDSSNVDIPICELGSAINSITHVHLVILASNATGYADLVLDRTYVNGATGIIVHSTQMNAENISGGWTLLFSFTQIFSMNTISYRLSNSTGSSVQYSVGLRVDRHNL